MAPETSPHPPTADDLPAWDTTTEYAGLESPDFITDLNRVSELTALIETGSGTLGEALSAEPLSDERWRDLIPLAQNLYRLNDECDRLLNNLAVFAECAASIDSKSERARSLTNDLQTRAARVSELMAPFHRFSLRLPEDLVTEFLADRQVMESQFYLRFARERIADTLLPIREEQLIDALGVNGHTAWGNAYTNVAGTAKTTIEIGGRPRDATLAYLDGLLQSPDPDIRHLAFGARKTIWTEHEEVAAASLNALAGWRLDINRRRSHTRAVDFLEAPLFLNRITAKTLETLIEVTRESRSIGQRALKLMARSRGTLHLHPADLFAPPPEKLLGDTAAPMPYRRARELITAAFRSVDPAMGDFVTTMVERRWIEARELPSKRPGAYCTGFAKSRTPRVYMTYMNGMRDAKVLAHELGHALHEYVMRDLPRIQTNYPMCVAETASNFAEMTVSDYIARESSHPREILAGAWQAVQDGATYTLNIPARFEFEREFYRRRAAKTFSPEEFRALMAESWRTWYGDTLTEPDEMFWASKMHFHISSLSFYNFPYLFGFLFSLGVYAQRAALGRDFYPAYVRLLRDTGRLTVEDLAERHLGVRLDAPDFWRQSFSLFSKQVDVLAHHIGD
jgi:oligoendopeptidase F